MSSICQTVSTMANKNNNKNDNDTDSFGNHFAKRSVSRLRLLDQIELPSVVLNPKGYASSTIYAPSPLTSQGSRSL